MTNDVPMTEDTLAVLSAFVDGEPVPPAALAIALAEPGSHSALVDFARLRAALADDESRPSPGFYRGAEARLATPAVNRQPTRARQWAWRLCAAAVIAMAAVGAGSLTGWIPAQPGPPRPQRVLRFEAGVDWHEEAAKDGGRR